MIFQLCKAKFTNRNGGWQRQLSIWGEECDEDVSDVSDKLGVLVYEVGELEDQFIDKYDQYRVTVKSIRNIEASVQPSRDSMGAHLGQSCVYSC